MKYIFLLFIFCLLPCHIMAQDETVASDVQLEVLEGLDPVLYNAEEEVEAAHESVEILEGIESILGNFAQRLIIAIAILAGLIIVLCIIWHIFKRITLKITETHEIKIKPLYIKKLKILSAKQIIQIIQFFLCIIKYVI